MNHSNSEIIIICGITATGKSQLAAKLGQLINGEVINADSQQVYTDMDIIAQSPSSQMLSLCPHHLYSIVKPNEKLSAADWANLAEDKVKSINELNKTPILCGGTGFYIHALLNSLPKHPDIDKQVALKLEKNWSEELRNEIREILKTLDPVSFEKIHPNDRYRNIKAFLVSCEGKPYSEYKTEKRKDLNFKGIILSMKKEQHKEFVYKRTKSMIDQGLVEEARALMDRFGDLETQKAIGFQEARSFLNKKLVKSELDKLINKNTLAYAKRQKTWFRNKFPEFKWLELEKPFDESDQETLEKVLSIIK